MPRGEHRPGQQEMCRAVAEALVTRTNLVVQAGTGTGRSLRYLAPLVLSGVRSSPRRLPPASDRHGRCPSPCNRAWARIRCFYEF
jgi:hypothetical protein